MARPISSKNPEKETQVELQIAASRGFSDWLAGTGASLALTTYQMGKVFLIGTGTDDRLTLSERSFPRSMGLVASEDGRRMWLAARNQVHMFQNAVPSGQSHEGNDAIYVPRMSWITGNLDAHDVAIGLDGRPIFAATRFNCLATVADGYSFAQVWRPPFISSIAPEDRCHLNGLAAEAGVPRYASVVARSDSAEGWRAARIDGGLIYDIADSEPVITGLTMPHSPRLRNGALWLLDSGRAMLCRADPATGHIERVAFCPGFARGMAFIDGHAAIGLSLPRHGGTFDGLPLGETMQRKGVAPFCGVIFVDLSRGLVVHWIRIEGPVREFYDVVVLPGIQRPRLLGFDAKDIDPIISLPAQDG